MVIDGGEGDTSEGRNGISAPIYFLQRAEESFYLPASETNEISLHFNLPLMPCPFCSAKPKLIFIRFQFKCTVYCLCLFGQEKEELGIVGVQIFENEAGLASGHLAAPVVYPRPHFPRISSENTTRSQSL